MTVDYALQHTIRTLVGYRNRLAEGVDALDRAIAVIEEFGHINPANLEPPAPATETPRALAGRKPGDKWTGGQVQCRWCPRDFRTPGFARAHERQSHPAEFAANDTAWMDPAEEKPAEQPTPDPQKARYTCTRPGCGQTFGTGQQLGAHGNKHKAEERHQAREAEAAETRRRTEQAAQQRQQEDRERSETAARQRADAADRRYDQTKPEPLAPPSGRRLDITSASSGLVPTGLPRQPFDVDKARRQAFEDIDDAIKTG